MRMIVAICGVLLCCASLARAEELADARQLLLTGKYDEAADAYAELSEQHPVESALGIARAKQSVGKLDEAEQVLSKAFEKQPKAADLPAELALLAFERGDLPVAQKHVDAALALDQEQPAARYLQAELHTCAGRLNEAQAGYEWLVDYQTKQTKLKSPDEIYWIGRAAAQLARWTRNSNQFKLLVNDLYPQALELDENFWPAHLETALLFLEKYNEGAATNELNAAIAINPNSAELYVAKAMLAMQKYDVKNARALIERAQRINPRLLAAQQILADLDLAEGRYADAEKKLLLARELNRADEETLGRLAVTYFTLDGWLPDDADSRANQLIAEVKAKNPKCGRFYAAMGDTFDLLRKYPQAAQFYALAQEAMPQLIYVRGRLGLVKMRLGDEQEAAQLLTANFRDDPFNVRVKNMLEVLDVLAGYAVLETEHFVIKFDRGQDEMLAKYAAKYLEEQVYPEVVKTLGYEPQGKSLFEIFSRAKNTRGHSWFSARMVGLPFIGTVGACGGKIVAMASPGDMPQKFHWGRVLKHEFVHVVNLQQTDFNIPHWFTEGLAVRLEDLPRPTSWDEILAKRAKADELFNLENINLGFIRPGSGEDWTLAYCQAELYCEYLVKTYGDHALAKLIRAYHDNLTTAAALKREFNVEIADFEKGYSQFVQAIVQQLRGNNDADDKRSLLGLERLVKDQPDNAQLQAELAAAYFSDDQVPAARKAALAANKLSPKQPLAMYVLARIDVSIGDREAALSKLKEVHDNALPEQRIVALLAALSYQAGDFAAAEHYYRLGLAHFAPRDQWLKALAKVYLKTEQDEALARVLTELAELDYDNLTLRRKLVQLAGQRKDWPAVERWAMDGLFIDINDAELHAKLAESRVNRLLYAGAIEEYRVAIEINPDVPAWRFALADALLEADQKEEAVTVLEKLLEVAPDFPGAELMLEQLRK